MKLSSIAKHVALMDRVEIRWVDVLICRHMEMQGAAWVHFEDNETWDLPIHITLGYLIYMDEEKIVLTGTQSLSSKNHVDVPMVFPMGCITHLWTLKTEEAIHEERN